MMKVNIMRLAVPLLMLCLAGCQGAFNPFDRPGNWAETGAANETIAQQVAQKSDLISGQSEPGVNGVVAVGGVEKATTGGTATGIQTTITPTTVASSINSGN
ncbi:MAG: hypothetical protein KGH75_03665 [Rhodospirillales bacterium]|nr:hypothetical protein [Rhodospirillales bacterium]